MRALTGLSCSQMGKTGAAGKGACIGSGVLTALVFRSLGAAVLGAGLRLAWGGLATAGAWGAAGTGVGAGAVSALDVEAFRGLAALTSGAF